MRSFAVAGSIIFFIEINLKNKIGQDENCTKILYSIQQ